MSECENADCALEALPEIAADAGVRDYQPCPLHIVEAEWKAARLAGAVPVAFGSADYPTALADIPDPPPILWCLGNLDLLKRPAIALVGARNASSLGTRMARKLAADLGAEGNVIVSGLARGVDTAAHLAALESGTIAVLAGGVDVVYPSENAVLAQEIQDKGLRLSESPMGLVAHARHFPRRNRIISGLARGVVVVEAAAKSGSLISARTALDQGRDVLSVPGHPFDARASGCNMLIRDGAPLVRSARDVLEALESQMTETPPAPAARPAPPSRQTIGLHQQILDRLGPSPIAEDQLIRDLNATARQLSPEIVTLELEGRIKRDAGGLLSRVN